MTRKEDIPDDQILLQQFSQPELRERAYTQLIQKYQEKIYWHIRRMVGDHEDANDVLQNTFIRVWNGLAQFRGDARFYTWLYRIASNECLSFLEQKKRKATESFDAETTEVHPKSRQVAATDSVDAQKLERKLQEAIKQLPEKQRLVFSLRYYDEMPYEEMSLILDTSVGALKASYHHAVKKIEDYLLNR
jgi:RNA polymerase sigma factor (sigma-70 family)